MKKTRWWDRFLNYFEDFEQEFKFTLRPIALILVFIIFWLVHIGRNNFGDVLPNPVNIFNHIGNVDSVVPALFVGFFVGFVATQTLKLNRDQFMFIGVLAGTIIGLVCNFLIETPFGMRLLDQPNVSDPLDIVWGTTFCLIACLAIFRVIEKK